MARKPAPGLPDVFASPGGAPSRGAAIEDLPEPAAAMDKPEPAPPPAPLVSAQLVPRPIAPAAAVQPPPSPGAPLRQHAFTIAIAALIVSLTAPIWEGPVLGVVGIHSSAEQTAQQATLAVQQQQRRVDELSRQLAAAADQSSRQQAEFTASLQRVGQAAALVRTMALVRLSDALRQPAPFSAELAMVRSSGPDQRDFKSQFDRIGPYAAIGIPSAGQLRQEFRALFDQLHAASGNSGSWVGNLAFWSSAPQQAPDPSLQQLQVAASHLASGDLAGALVPMRQMGDAYQTYFANWLEDANARVAADTIVDQVTNSVATSLR